MLETPEPKPLDDPANYVFFPLSILHEEGSGGESSKIFGHFNPRGLEGGAFSSHGKEAKPRTRGDKKEGDRIAGREKEREALGSVVGQPREAVRPSISELELFRRCREAALGLPFLR